MTTIEPDAYNDTDEDGPLVDIIHVYPVSEVHYHTLNQGHICDCGPRVEMYPNGDVVIHRQVVH